MRIAILMSTYNGHNYLDKQLESIAEQTVISDLKLYIRDDGSSDDTLEIINRWKERIDIELIKGENIGPAKSFWQLFMDTDIKADFYAFCDQDDIWDSFKVKAGISALENEECAALWCSNCRIIDSTGRVIAEKMNEKEPNFSIISQLVCGTTQGCAMLFNDKLRKHIFDKNIIQIPMHDFVIMTYAIANGKVYYDEKPYFGYRVHSNNVVANNGKNSIQHIKSSLNRWFADEHRNELSTFAKKFFKDNKEYLDVETQKYISNLIMAKHSVMARFKIVFNKNTFSANKNAERSFKIRTLLGVI